MNSQQTFRAATLTRSSAGKTFKPQARNVYAGLTTKFELVNPAGTAPTTPPTAAFLGDTIKVTAAGGAGKITFTATAKNAGNVTIELLLQKLPNKDRMPSKGGYRSQAFNVYDATLSSAVSGLAPGWYAPAYRFVNSATGQEQVIIALPAVQVS